MTIREIRSQRIRAEIPAVRLAVKAQINRSRLSEMECGHVQPTDEELSRLESALAELIHAKREVEAYVATRGWSAMVGV